MMLLQWLTPPRRHTNSTARLWEVDLARGVAIVLVVYYHLVFDLNFFEFIDIDLQSWVWEYQSKTIKSAFLFLVGLSLVLSLANWRKREPWVSEGQRFARYARRGAYIFCLGMLITLATSLALPGGTIHFGVLHGIGVCLVLAYPMLRLGWWNLPIGLVIIALAFVLSGVSIDGYWLLWLGVLPKNYWTTDYAPLIPNLGIVLLGVCAAWWLYPDNLRRYALPAAPGTLLARQLCLWGRHSLAIYLLHQPILFGALYAL